MNAGSTVGSVYIFLLLFYIQATSEQASKVLMLLKCFLGFLFVLLFVSSRRVDGRRTGTYGKKHVISCETFARKRNFGRLFSRVRCEQNSWYFLTKGSAEPTNPILLLLLEQLLQTVQKYFFAQQNISAKSIRELSISNSL